MKQSKAKLRVASKFNVNQLSEQPLFATNPQAALPLLSMIGQAQLSIDDLLGQLSRQFIEQLLVLSAQTVAGTKHPGRQSGDIRWHGAQSGVVAVGHSKLRVQRPRLRNGAGEVAVPAYAALAHDGDLSRRIADILVCNVSTRKYARVVHRGADALGISKSAVSRTFVKESAQALAKLMSRSFAEIDLVAIYVDGIIVALDEMFTITALGITGELARCLATTNVIESPNSVVRRVSRRVTNYKSADMALRWTAAGFLEAEKSFRKLRGFAQLKSLISGLRPPAQPVKKAA